MVMTVVEVLVAPMAGAGTAGRTTPSPNHPSLGGQAAATTSPTAQRGHASTTVGHIVATVHVVHPAPAPAAAPAATPAARTVVKPAVPPRPTTTSTTTSTAVPSTTVAPTTTVYVIRTTGTSSGADDASFSDSEGGTSAMASVQAAPAKPVNAATGLLARARVVPSGSLAGLRYHVVAKGDTVASIAKSYGIDPSVVRAANGVVAEKLYVGGRLMLEFPNPAFVRRTSAPAPTTTVRPAPTTTVPKTPGKTVPYTVVAGDTLSGIAKKTHTPLNTLLWLNKMTTTSKILPGRVMVTLPSAVSSPTTTVKPSPTTTTTVPATTGTWAASLPTMRCPVKSKFMNDWGFPRSSGRFHEGTDMFAPTGTPIVAPANGTLKYAMNGLGGLTFSLATDSGWTVYGAHLSARTPLTGRVAAGTVIGYVGNSGDAAGGPPHLHLGLRPTTGRMSNPYPVMKAACG